MNHWLMDAGDFCEWGTAVALLIWIGQYWVMEDWFRNAIGIRLVGLAACVIAIYVPSLMALADPGAYAGFAGTAWYQWLVLGIVIASFGFAVTGNVTWEAIRRRKARDRRRAEDGRRGA